jgi:hypothetical protein
MQYALVGLLRDTKIEAKNPDPAPTSKIIFGSFRYLLIFLKIKLPLYT